MSLLYVGLCVSFYGTASLIWRSPGRTAPAWQHSRRDPLGLSIKGET
jgi:hypothetical protein